MKLDFEIVGWRSLVPTIGVGRHMIDRWIRIYKFPKPKQGRKIKTWSSWEVQKWVAENEEIVEIGKRNSHRHGKGILNELRSPF